MRPFRSILSLFVALALVLAPASFATVSNTVSVATSLQIGESVSISLSTNNILLSTSAPSQTLQITTSWVLAQGHTSANLYTYFSALPFGGGTIGTLGSNAFQTTLGGGPTTVCTQPVFANGAGIANQDCSSFTLTQNVATDLNDTVTTPFTITFAPQANSFPAVGTYSNGTLVFLFAVS